MGLPFGSRTNTVICHVRNKTVSIHIKTITEVERLFHGSFNVIFYGQQLKLSDKLSDRYFVNFAIAEQYTSLYHYFNMFYVDETLKLQILTADKPDIFLQFQFVSWVLYTNLSWSVFVIITIRSIPTYSTPTQNVESRGGTPCLQIYTAEQRCIACKNSIQVSLNVFLNALQMPSQKYNEWSQLKDSVVEQIPTALFPASENLIQIILFCTIQKC